MDAYNFSFPIGDNEENYCFGVNDDETAKTLRRLAKSIELGKIAIQSCRVVSTAKNEDFTQSILKLTFTEKRVRTSTKDKLSQLAAILPTKETPEDFKLNMSIANEKKRELGIEENKKLFGSSQFPVAVAHPDTIK